MFLNGFAAAYSVIDTSNIDVNKSSFTAVSGLLYSQEIADPQRFQHGVAFFTLPENMELKAVYDVFRMGRIIDGQPVWLTSEQYAVGFVELERPLLAVFPYEFPFPYEGWERGVDYAIDISGSATSAANNKGNETTSCSTAKAAAPRQTTLSVVFRRAYSSVSGPNGESIEQEVTDRVQFSPGAMLLRLPDDVDVMTCGGVLLARVIDQQLHWIERTEYTLTLLDTEEPTLMIIPSEGWEYGIDYAIRLLETVKNTDGYPVNEYGRSWKSGKRTLDLVRNETGSVTVALKGMVPPRKQGSIPNLKARFFYNPYGQAHIELGPELRSIEHDPELTTNDGINQEPLDQGDQDNPVIGIVGGLLISMSIELDPATLPGAIMLRELIGGVSVPLGSGEVVIAQDENDEARVLVMPVGGFLEGRTYEVMLGPGLKDTFGRLFTPPDEGANHFLHRVSVPIEVVSVDEALQGTPKTIPIIYDSAKASAATLDCRDNPEDDPEPCFPGGLNFLFQGAWTDPTTGIAYHRNRWYDPRTANWLSEDPLGAVDSPNLYAFVGWGPHVGRDPMGLRGPCDWTGNATCGDVWSGVLDEGKEDASLAVEVVEGIPPRVGAWVRGKSSGALLGDSPVDPDIAKLREALEVPSDVSIDQNVQSGRTFNRRFVKETGDVVEKLSSEGTEQGMWWGAGKTLEYGFGLLLTKSRGLLGLEKRVDDVAPGRGGRYVYDAGAARYRDLTTGRFVAQRKLPFPLNRGFASSTRAVVGEGTIVGRYGPATGRYAGPPGASVSELGLPAGSGALPYSRYRVLKPFEAEIGPAARVPEFGASGGATQYRFDVPIEELVRRGYLEALP